MKNIIRFSLFFSLLILSACTNVAKGPAFSDSKATQKKPGHATLYVFRKYAEPAGWGATLFIDDKEVSVLNQQGFTWVYAKPGTRQLSVVWPGMSGQQDADIQLTLSENKTYFIELSGLSHVHSLSEGKNKNRKRTKLNSIHPRFAERLLNKCCRFEQPKSDTY